jgi:hypothetical protein
MFAKLFGKGDSQVLVIKKQDEDGAPAIVTFAHPPGLDVCETTASFADSEEGEANRDKAFDSVDQDTAFRWRDALFESTKMFDHAD